MNNLIKEYSVALFSTVTIWLAVAVIAGPQALVLVVILTLLEITLSADNAVINSRVLLSMSPLWQKLFVTVGIFIAVFVIRFVIPVVIVALATSLDFGQTLQLAINNPQEYGQKLSQASPAINTFGGVFLGLVALFFFVDGARRDFWLTPIERFLARIGNATFSRSIIALFFISVLYGLLRNSPEREIMVASGLLAVAIYALLHGAVKLMARINKSKPSAQKVGWAAFIAFLYLEVLDATFSLDEVIGAFALTNNVIIIVAGLGAGAVWVRSMTLHLTKTKALLKYKYLESGAHWAILFLAAVLILKLFHIELYDALVGSVGLVFISMSLLSSRRSNAA